MRPGRGIRTRLVRAGLAVLLAAGARAAPVTGQATSLLPADDPARDDLELLQAAGLLPWSVRGQGRLAVGQVASLAAAAGTRLPAGASPGLREAVARLQARFPDPPRRPFVGPAEVRLDARWADAPPRAIPTAYADVSRIEADVVPLLDRDLGRPRVDGPSGGLELAADLHAGRHLVVHARGRGWAEERVDRQEDDLPVRADGRLQELYLRLRLADVAVDVGRQQVILGQGADGGVFLSDNAAGLDLVRISTAEPFRMPGLLGRLGRTRASAFLADLGEDRRIPHALLFVGKVSIQPTPWLEVGGTWLNQQGGEGAPPASLRDRILDLLPIPFVVKEISERMLGVDVRVTSPRHGITAYVDGLTTDINFLRLHEVLWEEASWTVGVRAVELGPGGRGTLRLEGHRVGIRPYTHHNFPSGLTLDRRVLGSAIGPHARGVHLDLEWAAPTMRLGLSGAWDHFSGDLYRANGLDAGDLRWVQITDGRDEERLRAVATWSLTGRLRPSVRLGVERVRDAGFRPGSRTNWVAEALLVWRP